CASDEESDTPARPDSASSGSSASSGDSSDEDYFGFDDRRSDVPMKETTRSARSAPCRRLNKKEKRDLRDSRIHDLKRSIYSHASETWRLRGYAETLLVTKDQGLVEEQVKCELRIARIEKYLLKVPEEDLGHLRSALKKEKLKLDDYKKRLQLSSTNGQLRWPASDGTIGRITVEDGSADIAARLQKRREWCRRKELYHARELVNTEKDYLQFEPYSDKEMLDLALIDRLERKHEERKEKKKDNELRDHLQMMEDLERYKQLCPS
ncbi:hypothetical protein PFISCL1PPCAC_367, partial [Pristionchus fissidentatus]